MTIRRISYLDKLAKAHLIDKIRAARGTTQDIIRILATLEESTIHKRTGIWTWRFTEGKVQHHPATQTWRVTIQEETWTAEEDSADASTPKSKSLETKPLAT